MNEFKQRRADLMAKIGPDAAVVIPAALMRYRSRDVEYPYRQDSDFYYFTGFEEPEAVMVLLPGDARDEEILYCRPNDYKAELWTGPRVGSDHAAYDYHFDVAYEISDFEDVFEKTIGKRSKIYTTNLEHPVCESLQNNLSITLNDINDITSDMRLIKSQSEIYRIKRAVEISVAAHSRAMRFVGPGQMEFDVEAEILHEFIRRGSRSPAYSSIVGGGENSCTLHYVDNNKPLNAGDLVLVDAGAEYDYYASDITRTYPVNGKFTNEQKLIYELVLAAQLAVIEKVKPGMHWNELQKTAVQIITKGLVGLNILSGDVDELIEQEKYKQFYMHGSGHWMGMDVHDVGSYKVDGQPRALKPGMVFTVEPGIYISATNDVDKKWHNIGVRIEDDILVTENGCDVMSGALPKTIKDIELLMAQKT